MSHESHLRAASWLVGRWFTANLHHGALGTGSHGDRWNELMLKQCQKPSRKSPYIGIRTIPKWVVYDRFNHIIYIHYIMCVCLKWKLEFFKCISKYVECNWQYMNRYIYIYILYKMYSLCIHYIYDISMILSNCRRDMTIVTTNQTGDMTGCWNEICHNKIFFPTQQLE